MLLRLIVIAIAIWLLVRVGRKLLNPPPPPPQPSKQTFEQVVKCAHCGLHIPQNQAINEDNRWYCSPQHRDAARRP